MVVKILGLKKQALYAKVMLLNMKWQRIVLNQKAMTLIELLVTLSLLVVVTTLLAAIFKEGLISYDQTVNEADIQLSVRHQSDVIIEDIRSSKIAVVNGVSYPQVESAKLILYTGTLESPETTIYFLNGASILRQVNSDTPKVVLQDVTQFQVSLSQPLVTVKIGVNPASTHYQEPITKAIVLHAIPRATLPTLTH